MEADFSGWATKALLKCKDGRTIMPGAFKHQDKMQVPLVWQHGHTDPENVLGHMILENRGEDGVYAYGFFNDTVKAKHAKQAVEHKDIKHMSIYANELVERAKKVFHGAIKEVSLVLSGANPGALIENVQIRHADGDLDTLEEDVIIHTGLPFDDLDDDEIEDEDKEDKNVEHADGGDKSLQEIVDSMTDEQREVLHFLVGTAIETADEAKHDDIGDDDDDNNDDPKGKEMMHHNVFEDDDTKGEAVISHDDMVSVIKDGKRMGSLKHAVEEYALAHGITDIDTLFPDAVNLDRTPQFLQRRVEWVNVFLSGTTKSPFSRIKTVSADITMEEARAKGYIKGTLKKEEFFGVTKRETTPTTVYKKQALDRDDVVDITDFDVIAWLKSEMRLMLDEEVARAGLMGDGRDPSHEDKINEGNIRPIATDHELFVTTVNVNMNDASSSVQEFIDAVVMNRRLYKGTGQPTMFTSETLLSRFLLLKDTTGRRIYRNLDEVASELRVSAIVPVEVMEEDPTLLAIIVNPADYTYGATEGGKVSMFDDFDIDYNKEKFLIETRCCGALTKLKSAIVVRGVAGTDVLASPAVPTFDPETGALTITNTTGVVYKHGATVVNAAGSPYTVDPGETWIIDATPASGYYFATSEDDQWSFTADA